MEISPKPLSKNFDNDKMIGLGADCLYMKFAECAQKNKKIPDMSGTEGFCYTTRTHDTSPG